MIRQLGSEPGRSSKTPCFTAAIAALDVLAFPHTVPGYRSKPPHDPSLFAMRCVAAKAGAIYEWHEHPFYELNLVSEDSTTVGTPVGWCKARPNSFYLWHPRERHASQAGPKQQPSFWVTHFAATPEFMRQLPRLSDPDPARRIWSLDPDQAEAFRWLFLQLLNEHSVGRSHQSLAERGLLYFLLASAERWVSGNAAELITPETANPELTRLWHLVNASVGQPAEFQDRIPLFPNYSSLRHLFKRVFGCSPREMMQRLRFQHAKSLLLESRSSIKDIADRCGYQRQHEFSRAFRRQTGVSPTVWREEPAARVSTSTTSSFTANRDDGQRPRPR